MNKHKEENCTVPFCRDCLDRIKAVKSKADSLHFKAKETTDHTKALHDEIKPLVESFARDAVAASKTARGFGYGNQIDEIMLAVGRHVQAARIDEYENHFPHRKIKKTVWAVTETDIKERIAALRAKPTESKPATDHTYDGTGGPIYRNGD